MRTLGSIIFWLMGLTFLFSWIFVCYIPLFIFCFVMFVVPLTLFRLGFENLDIIGGALCFVGGLMWFGGYEYVGVVKVFCDHLVGA